MKSHSFSISEASSFLHKYENLALQLARTWQKDKIECIAVSPADRLNKFLFLDIYKQTGCPHKALEFYKHTTFDVIIIFSSNNKKGEWYYMELDAFLLSHNVTLDTNMDIVSVNKYNVA